MSISRERLGQLFILVGPGGVGKNALLNEIIARIDDIRQLPTATTRSIRPGEKEGREHQFLSLSQFEQMIVDNELIEYQEVHPGKYYGVPRVTVETAIEERQDMIADIEVLGTGIIRKRYPHNSISIFIAPPSVEALAERLRGRDASDTEIKDRLNRLPMEMLYAPAADYVIVNDDFDTAVHELNSLVLELRDENSLQDDIANVKRTEISYQVEVFPICGDEMLVASDSKLALGRVVEQMKDPAAVAINLLEDTFKLPANQAKLTYQKPDGSIQVHCDYDPQNHKYDLIYSYTYRVDKKIELDGYSWVAVNR